MAEFLFKHLASESGLSRFFQVSSAATTSWSLGEPVHPGTQAVLKKHGIPFDPGKRARRLTPDDYLENDFILAMDSHNLRHMPNLDKIHRLTEFAPPGTPLDVPDPYYTGDFDSVYALIHAGCAGFISWLRDTNPHLKVS